MEIEKDKYTLFLSDSLNDKYDAAEIECKGYYYDAVIKIKGCNKKYQLNIYDIVRFKQDVEDELKKITCYFEPNLIFIELVNITTIIKACDEIVQNKYYKKMVIMEE